MDALLAPIALFGANSIPTSILEIAASVITIACVVLAARNKIISYPVGIIGTILFFFVFWTANLYASAILQLYFLPIQLYGWWFWTRGDKGKEPKITDWSWGAIGGLMLLAVFLTYGLSGILQKVMPDQVLPGWDVAILTLSVAAQFLLDRRIMKTWWVWLAVNTISVPLYASQGLYLTAIVYGLLWVNAFHGYFRWKAIRVQQVGGELVLKRGTPGRRLDLNNGGYVVKDQSGEL